MGWSQNLVEIRRSLKLTPDGDAVPVIVRNRGFADCYKYVEMNLPPGLHGQMVS